MKKWIALILTVMLTFTMIACTTQEPQSTTQPGNSDPSKPIMKEPPKLTVFFGEGDSFEAFAGSYTWTYDVGDGTTSGTKADSLHPLECLEFLTPMETTVNTVELRFEVQPQHVNVRCWSDSRPWSSWGDVDAFVEKATLSGNTMELKDGGYVYEVEATWNGENLAANGTVRYVFYVVKHSVQYAHDHSLADIPQTVDDPVEYYCGNTITKILVNEKEYSFMGNDSVTLTDILINLNYDPNLLCKCLPDFYVEIESGVTYGVNLSGYARCEAGQADLTQEQLETIRRIMNDQTK